MPTSDRAFRALASQEPEVVVATLRAVVPDAVGYRRGTPLTTDDLRPTRLDALPPPLDVDWLATLADGSLLHLECQGYRDPSFPDRQFGYHLWLVLRHPEKRVRTVALWLTDPPPKYTEGYIERGDVSVRVRNVVLPRVPAEALLEDPDCACFAAGADRGPWSDRDLCDRVVAALVEARASWSRRHMAVVAAAMRGRYNTMLEAMERAYVEPIIIEDLVHIGEDIGYAKGLAEGLREALNEQRQMLRKVLDLRGVSITHEQGRRLEACDDRDLLRSWVDLALRGEDPASWLR